MKNYRHLSTTNHSPPLCKDSQPSTESLESKNKETTGSSEGKLPGGQGHWKLQEPPKLGRRGQERSTKKHSVSQPDPLFTVNFTLKKK